MLLSTAMTLSDGVMSFWRDSDGVMLIVGAVTSSSSSARGRFRCFPSPAPWKKLLADFVWRAPPCDDIIYNEQGGERGF